MASFFKRFKKKLPAVSSKNSAYYNRENLIVSLKDLKKTLAGAPEIKAFSTSKELTFNNISLLDISPVVLRNTFDTPAHVMDRSGHIPGHKVVFYKDSVAHYKFLIQYHFINEQFFFASNKISSTTILSDKDKAKTINRISNKYLGTDHADVSELVVKVMDPNGSIIYTVDDVYFYMNYLPENALKQKLLEKYADVSDQPVKPQGLKESLEKYI